MGIRVIHGRHFNRHARHGKAVGAVGGNFAVKYRIGNAEILGYWHTNRSVIGKNHDAVVLISQTKLSKRTIHAT